MNVRVGTTASAAALVIHTLLCGQQPPLYRIKPQLLRQSISSTIVLSHQPSRSGQKWEIVGWLATAAVHTLTESWHRHGSLSFTMSAIPSACHNCN